MSIRASASAREITPKERFPLIGYPGIRRFSTGTRDPLFASAVHLRSGSGGIIVLSLDLLYLDPLYARDIRHRISEATGTSERNVFVGTTQTHSGPPASRALYWSNDPSYSEPDTDYIEFVIDQAVQAASVSAVTSRPAAVATVSLDKPNTGALIVKDSTQNRVIALIIVHQDIPNHLGPDNNQVSSDFVHVVRERLAKRFGSSPVIIYFSAPSGDRKLRADIAVPDKNAATKQGNALADLVISKVKALTGKDFLSHISFAGKFLDVYDLPRRKLPEPQEAGTILLTAQKIASKVEEECTSQSEREVAKWAVMQANSTIGFILAQKQGVFDEILDAYEPPQVHLMRIGEVRLLGIPGTIMPDCGHQLASKIGENVWVTECVNGDLQGSILVVSDEDSSRYRLASALFEPEAGQLLAESAISLASSSV